jgi:sugar phosphate permease
MNELIDLLQWPAMLVTILAAWLVGSRERGRRKIGFWVFLASNALWIAWGLPAKAYALVLLQLCLAAMNIRGSYKNRRRENADG